MHRFVVLIGFCIVSAGCNGDAAQQPDGKDTLAVYEVILREEIKNHVKGPIYVSVDFNDPAPELLAKLAKQWPDVLPQSKRPKERQKRGTFINVHVEQLKWIDANTAELKGGFANGMDGRGSRYRVERKNGAWGIVKTVVEVES